MKSYLRRFLYFFTFVVVFASCDNFKDVEPITNNEYFIAKQDIATYPLSDITTFLNLAPTFFPELADYIEPISNSLTSDVHLVKISYKTTFKGEDIIASGVVSIPTTPGTYPVLSFQNGTNTLHSNAPSESDYTLLSQNNVPLKLLSMMASSGFVIAIPDYLGFGDADNTFHPYLDRESTVQSVLDMLRAIREMMEVDSDVNVSSDLYLNGYSQGGWATMALQRTIETQYASEFNLKASACGGGPHDLVAFTDFLVGEDTYPMPYFLAYLFNSYMNLGMTTPIDSIFQEPYASRIPNLFDGTKDGGAINEQLTTTISDLLQPGFIENWNKGGIYESLYTMLEDNSNAGYSTTTPTLLIHGLSDTYVPAFLSENLYTEFTVNYGVSTDLVSLLELPGLGHTDAIVPSGLTSITWFIDIKDGN